MNLLLVWPEIPLTYWGAQYSIRLLGKRAVMPPLALLTVAAMCPSDWKMRLVDLNIEKLEDSDIAWADLVMISGMIVQHESIQEVLTRCEKAGVKTALGGPDATSSPEKFAKATYLILDEGEITLPQFLRDLSAGKPQRTYTACGEKPDVTATPVPRFDLLNLEAYTHMCIQFSRGCPFACEFCDITTLYGKKPRTKLPEQITAELQAIYNTGFRGEIFLVDDNFIGNKKNVKAMLPALISWQEKHGFPFWLYTEASLNLSDDDELLDLMCKAGFHAVFVGIESPSMESLRETQKYQNTNGDLLSKVHHIQKFGIEVMAGFILGFDSDKEDIFERQIEFITRARIPMAMVGALNAMPATQLWQRLKAEGRLKEDFTGDNLAVPNFHTTLPTLTLVTGYKHVLSTLYSPEGFFSRLKSLVAAMKGSQNKTQGRLKLDGSLYWGKRLIPALVRLWLVDPLGKDYWNFMTWIWLNHPDKWMYALSRAIAGYHFIRYTAEVMVPRLETVERDLSTNPVQEEFAHSLKAS
ncbi:MAG TPA: B12-binding domain-containing radical SAM protein [Oculatellaceae cyanobacterium]